MNIRIATSDDEKRWDDYVAAHSTATPYHRFAWGKACTQAYGQPMNYWLAEDDASNIIGVLPGINFKKPLSSSKIIALPYCDTGFAIANDEDTQNALLATLPDASDYRDLIQTPADTTTLTLGQKVILRLPLPESSEALLASFKSKLRSQVRKAEKNGLTMKLSESYPDHQALLGSFYSVYQQNMRQLASPVHAYEWFDSILKHYDNNARLCVVFNDTQPIGAGIVIINGEVAAIPWASTLSQFNRLAPNMMLYWSLLANVTDNGQSVFDFGRSSYGEGTYKFKTQWGAVPYALHWHNGSVTELKDAVETGPPGAIRKLAESIWPKLPLGLTVSFGSAIRRYISL